MAQYDGMAQRVFSVVSDTHLGLPAGHAHAENRKKNNNDEMIIHAGRNAPLSKTDLI
jgi:hypothetical protein